MVFWCIFKMYNIRSAFLIRKLLLPYVKLILLCPISHTRALTWFLRLNVQWTFLRQWRNHSGIYQPLQAKVTRADDLRCPHQVAIARYAISTKLLYYLG